MMIAQRAGLGMALWMVASALAAAGAAPEVKPPKVGDRIVDFQLKKLDGKVLKTADFRKDKVFVLKFGATWCGWCNRQIPHLNRVHKEYAGKVAVLDVDVRETAARVREHNKKKRVRYVTVLDPDAKVAVRYGVRGIPVVIIADQKGKIVFRGYYTPFEKLKEVIDGLLPKKEPKAAS